jgi:hypothetical protein
VTKLPAIETGDCEEFTSLTYDRGEIENPAERYKPKRFVVARSASKAKRFRKLLVKWRRARRITSARPSSLLNCGSQR